MASDQLDDDDDEDVNVTSGAADVESRDCGGSLTSLSPSESDYIDVESPGCSHHHGGLPLSLPPSATSSSIHLLDSVRRGLRDMQATVAALHCSF